MSADYDDRGNLRSLVRVRGSYMEPAPAWSVEVMGDAPDGEWVLMSRWYTPAEAREAAARLALLVRLAEVAE